MNLKMGLVHGSVHFIAEPRYLSDIVSTLYTLRELVHEFGDNCLRDVPVLTRRGQVANVRSTFDESVTHFTNMSAKLQ
jgi:hypothetical protein